MTSKFFTVQVYLEVLQLPCLLLELFYSSTAADLLVILNGLIVEVTNDFVVLGSSPYTQIEFNYALPANSTLIFKQRIG